MDQMTQQNAAMVEQTTAASHALANGADELAELIGRFDVGQAASPAKVPAPARAQLRTVGRGGPARKPDPQVDEWQEF
jgi:methyl-accepting chemotaxis protein